MLEHHAVLLVGRNFSESGYFALGQPLDTELSINRFDILSISEVRKIITSSYTKPLAQPTKTIVIEANSIATEAQHALLKVLEEPPLTTKFILVLQSKVGLLPTLLSRLCEPKSSVSSQYESNAVFDLFMKSSYATRLELIAKITKDKNQDTIDLICQGVLSLLLKKSKTIQHHVLLQGVEKMNLRGSSKKMLLEEIALTLPVVA